MTILIFGLGSIAKKHIAAINDLQIGSSIIALRSKQQSETCEGVQNIFNLKEIKESPDFIIISNPTSLHKDAIMESLNFNCPLFIEKPVLSQVADADEILQKMQDSKPITYVACNLRFHPSLVYLKQKLSNRKLKITEVNVYCGSNLADWRPTQDYSKSYSAIAEMGGGVHLDLIHELDYCYWLFGKPNEVRTVKRKVSSLKINSFDFASFTLIYSGFTINVILNYYRKQPRRSIEIIAEEEILYADLNGAVVNEDERALYLQPSFLMGDTYTSQMKYFLEHIKSNTQPMNSFEEAVEVLKIACQ